MKNKKDEVLSFMQKEVECAVDENITFSTMYLAKKMNMQRTNISTILNQLEKEQRVEKINGRPVLYKLYHPVYHGQESTSFQHLIGFNGSLKNAIQTAKAAIMYPEQPLHILLMGEKGCGTSEFARAIYDFAIEKQILAESAPFIKVSCNYYLDNINELSTDLFQGETSIFQKAKGGILFFDHIHLLPVNARTIIYDLITASTYLHPVTIIFSSDTNVDKALEDLYFNKIPIKIMIPNLASLSLQERFTFIQQNLLVESNKMNIDICAETELLRMLLLYPCEGNLKQLHEDLRIGCANAYVRNYQVEDHTIHLLMKDFPSYIRKGLIFYKRFINEVDKLIPIDYQYIYAKQKIEKNIDYRDHLDFYEDIKEKSSILKNSGFQMDDIETIVTSDLRKRIYHFTKELHHMDMEILSKVVNKRLINETKEFLDHVSIQLKKVFPMTTFYGLCLHLSSIIRNHLDSENINVNIVREAEIHKKEYEFSIEFISHIETIFNVRLYKYEAVLVTMFLTAESDIADENEIPGFLIAMHGEQAASSLVDVVSELTGNKRVFAYDLSLHKDMDTAYDDLKTCIQRIDNGKGIIMMYDMGSLKIMGENIAKETGINIQFMNSPITLLAMECARKTAVQDDILQITNELKESYEHYYPFLVKNYQRKKMKKIIITLCMTGDGSSIQIKQYLDKYLTMENIEIIPLDIRDENILLETVNKLRKVHDILYIIGLKNPHLYNIPFIPISQIYALPSNKLTMLLSIGEADTIMKGKIEYTRICNQLKESYPDLDIEGMKHILPKVIEEIENKYPINQDQRIVIFMYFARSIQRLLNHEHLPAIKPNKMILHNKKMMHFLYERIQIIENHFHIQYNDEEIANVIQIIKKV